MRVSVERGSVLDARTDAVVNAANTELHHGGGVARALAVAAGPDFDRESRAAVPCPLGSAVATGAGRLPFRCVLHVPTLDWSSGRRAGADELARGVEAALRLAVDRGCRSVAFPLLGAGIAGWGAEESCRAMAAGFGAAASGGRAPDAVVVYGFTEAEWRAAESVLGAGTGSG
jgi:O-acetyl-ADP-ribose deacetylase (regulator of RNase III)